MLRTLLGPEKSSDLLLLLEGVSLGILPVLDGLLVESLLGVLGLLEGLLFLPWTLNRTEFGVSLPEGPPLTPPTPKPDLLGPGFPAIPALPAPTFPRPLPLPLPLPLPRPPNPPSTCSDHECNPAVGATLPTPANGTLAPLTPLPI